MTDAHESLLFKRSFTLPRNARIAMYTPNDGQTRRKKEKRSRELATQELPSVLSGVLEYIREESPKWRLGAMPSIVVADCHDSSLCDVYDSDSE